MAEGTQLIRGLEGVVAAETELCDLDGTNGRLAYRGYDIADLAGQATFEEVAYLLWMGELPTRVELDRFLAELATARPIPEDLVKAFAVMPKQTDPMRVLQASVAILGMHDPDATDNTHAANLRKSVRLTSQFATAICAHHRVRSELEPVPPAKDLPLAANFLYMLTGKKPSNVTTKAFDASLVLYAEHELNASTFTTRVIAATLSDMHSAVAGGVGATKKLIPNVDFYSAPLFYSIGIPVDLFTPVIAASRIVGWTANLLEQYDDNRLIRPRADYKGPGRKPFVPVEKR